MYAIVEIQGQQFKAEAGKYLYVHYLGENVKEGDSIDFDKVLVFKKKRRKGYRRLNGHRQCFTQVEIKDVVA